MSKPVRVTSVEHLGGRVLRLVFSDGFVRELDFQEALPGFLEIVDTDEVFPQAVVDPIAGTVSWPVGVDLDPDVLRGVEQSADVSGARLISEYQLRKTS